LNYEERNSTGVLLLNLGGPDSVKAVRPFLFNLFSDREIIRLGPSFMQKPLAYLISSIRAQKTEDSYKLIGGKSPIYDITHAQAKALEESLNLKSEARNEDLVFKVYIGMRYWHPFIEDSVEQMYRDGIKKIIAISLYPHYSTATTGSSFKIFEDTLEKKYQTGIRMYAKDATNHKKRVIHPPLSAYFLQPNAFCVTSWYNHPLYIDALVDVIRKGIGSFNQESGISSQKPEADVHLLFSAHGLPVRFIEEGDPYVDQVKGTISEITKQMDIRWDLSYQSRSGPVKWLEPSTAKMIKGLAQKGIKNLLVVPISFVSDHIETLFEIDILYRNMAKTLGMRLERTESLNTSPLFITALKDIVLKGFKEADWEG
jgi:ferrochelatase